MCPSTPKPPKPEPPAPIQPPVAPPKAPEVRVGADRTTSSRRRKISRSDLKNSTGSQSSASGLGA